jgi:hypothetical protein
MYECIVENIYMNVCMNVYREECIVVHAYKNEGIILGKLETLDYTGIHSFCCYLLLYTCVRKSTCIHMYTYIHVYIYVYIYTCVYICVYAHKYITFSLPIFL